MTQHRNGSKYPQTFKAPVVVHRRPPTADELVKLAEAGKPLEPEEQKRFCFSVEPPLHRAIKIAAAEKGISIRQLILDALHAMGIRE